MELAQQASAKNPKASTSSASDTTTSGDGIDLDCTGFVLPPQGQAATTSLKDVSESKGGGEESKLEEEGYSVRGRGRGRSRGRGRGRGGGKGKGNKVKMSDTSDSPSNSDSSVGESESEREEEGLLIKKEEGSEGDDSDTKKKVKVSPATAAAVGTPVVKTGRHAERTSYLTQFMAIFKARLQAHVHAAEPEHLPLLQPLNDPSSDTHQQLMAHMQEHAQQHFQVLHSVSGRVKKRPRDSDTGNGLGSGELNAKREKAVGANVLAGELGQKGQGRKGSVLGVGRGNEDVRLGRGREREDACVDEGRRGVVVKQEPDTEEGHASSPPPSDHPSSSPASEDAAACEGADTDGGASSDSDAMPLARRQRQQQRPSLALPSAPSQHPQQQIQAVEIDVNGVTGILHLSEFGVVCRCTFCIFRRSPAGSAWLSAHSNAEYHEMHPFPDVANQVLSYALAGRNSEADQRVAAAARAAEMASAQATKNALTLTPSTAAHPERLNTDPSQMSTGRGLVPHPHSEHLSEDVHPQEAIHPHSWTGHVGGDKNHKNNYQKYIKVSRLGKHRHGQKQFTLQQHSGQKQTHRVALETWLSKQGFAHDKHRGWHQVKGGAGQSQPGSAEQGQPDESARQGQKRKHEESVIEVQALDAHAGASFDDVMLACGVKADDGGAADSRGEPAGVSEMHAVPQQQSEPQTPPPTANKDGETGSQSQPASISRKDSWGRLVALGSAVKGWGREAMGWSGLGSGTAVSRGASPGVVGVDGGAAAEIAGTAGASVSDAAAEKAVAVSEVVGAGTEAGVAGVEAAAKSAAGTDAAAALKPAGTATAAVRATTEKAAGRAAPPKPPVRQLPPAAEPVKVSAKQRLLEACYKPARQNAGVSKVSVLPQSKHKGVSWDTSAEGGRWKAQIWDSRVMKQHFLGHFLLESAAAQAVTNAQKEIERERAQ